MSQITKFGHCQGWKSDNSPINFSLWLHIKFNRLFKFENKKHFFIIKILVYL